MRNKFIIYYLPAYIWAIIIFIGSSLPLNVPKFAGGLSDELCHLIEFGIFGLLLARAFKNAETRIFRENFLVLAFVVGCLYGVSDEYHQIFVPHRGLEILDLSADFLGSLLGVVSYAICVRNRSCL